MEWHGEFTIKKARSSGFPPFNVTAFLLFFFSACALAVENKSDLVPSENIISMHRIVVFFCTRKFGWHPNHEQLYMCRYRTREVAEDWWC